VGRIIAIITGESEILLKEAANPDSEDLQKESVV
jgi:hypothetical protein